jgi:hypothetical protein
MFDNLRDDSSSTFSEDIEAKYQPAAGYSGGRSSSKRFLGMTSMQRFVIAVLLMLTVCVLGAMTLFILGKMAI